MILVTMRMITLGGCWGSNDLNEEGLEDLLDIDNFSDDELLIDENGLVDLEENEEFSAR